jgi:hypothetical protein
MTRAKQAVAKQYDFDSRVRLFVYRQTIRTGRVPAVAEVAQALAATRKKVSEAFVRLSESHAFMLQDNGELWRAAPFLGDSDRVSCAHWQTLLVGQLHLGRARHPRHVAQRCGDRRRLLLLQLRDATCHKEWKASATGRRDPYRGARPRLV